MQAKNEYIIPVIVAALLTAAWSATPARAGEAALRPLDPRDAARFLKGGDLPAPEAPPCDTYFIGHDVHDGFGRGSRPVYLAQSAPVADAEDHAPAAPVVHSAVRADSLAFGVARSATDPVPEGAWTVTFNGGGLTSSQLKEGSFNVQAGVGYLVADQVEVGLRQALQYADFEDSAWAGSTRVYGDYHFDFERWQPFVGLSLSYTYGDAVSDTWAAGPEAGLKYFIKDEAFVFAMLQYDIFFRDASGDNDNFDDGQILYGVGLGLTF